MENVNNLNISSSKRVVVLTGAGISAESGISTFRDSNGLWENYRVEEVATPEAFNDDPVLVWKFYSARRKAAGNARPNLAHQALARFSEWSKANGRDFLLATQNVDCLHERAYFGTRGQLPIAMHGSLALSRCHQCEQQYWDDFVYFDDLGRPTLLPAGLPRFEGAEGPKNLIDALQLKRSSEGLPLSPCCLQPLRPHIVWFGEAPLHMDLIQGRLEQCDVFVSIGTSGNVYPAADFIRIAKNAGATIACLNPEPLPQQSLVDVFLRGPATQTVPKLFMAS